MKLQIQSRDASLTPNLENYIREKVTETMKSYSHRIARLTVRMSSIRQSKDVLDPQCCVEVEIDGQPTVVVIKRSHNARSTIRHAITSAGWAAVRLLDKKQLDKYRRNMGSFSYTKHRLQGVAA